MNSIFLNARKNWTIFICAMVCCLQAPVRGAEGDADASFDKLRSEISDEPYVPRKKVKAKAKAAPSDNDAFKRLREEIGDHTDTVQGSSTKTVSKANATKTTKNKAKQPYSENKFKDLLKKTRND